MYTVHVHLPGGNLKTDSTFNPSTLNSRGSESWLLGTLLMAISTLGKLQSPGSYLVWMLIAFFRIYTRTCMVANKNTMEPTQLATYRSWIIFAQCLPLFGTVLFQTNFLSSDSHSIFHHKVSRLLSDLVQSSHLLVTTLLWGNSTQNQFWRLVSGPALKGQS